MGLFKRMFGKDEVDPILGGLSRPSGLEARPAEPSGFSPTPAPEPGPAPPAAAEPLNFSNPLDMLKLAREWQHQVGSPEAAAQWMQQFYAAQGVDTGGEDEQLDQLERLAALHQRGALSDDEFAAAKAKLLGEA